MVSFGYCCAAFDSDSDFDQNCAYLFHYSSGFSDFDYFDYYSDYSSGTSGAALDAHLQLELKLE